MRLRIALGIAAITFLAILRGASASPWPDDWDGIGFVASIRRFDMAQFAPHPPGYPVYVAMLKIAAHLTPRPIAAANAIAVVTGVLAAAFAWGAARRAFDPSRAWWIAIATAATPLVWRASSSIGSEAPALLFVAIVLFGLTFDGAIAIALVGAGVGLGLGVRLSWAPLYLALLASIDRKLRLRALALAAAASLVWLVPLVVIVGPGSLRALFATHAEGHFTQWGGTSIRDPGLARVAYLARDLFVDGLGAGTDGLGIAIALVTVGLAIMGLQEWREAEWRHARAVAIVVVPYLVWIALGQNIKQQPRHALPLVAFLSAGLAIAATSVTRARTVGILFVFIVSLRTFGDAHDRLEFPPPGAQLVDRANALPDASRTAVFGGPSARYFELSALEDGAAGAVRAQTVGSLGDVSLAVGRMSNLPSRVLVTSELLGLDVSAYPLAPFATLCRPFRLDRRAPCVTVYEWRAPFLPPR